MKTVLFIMLAIAAGGVAAIYFLGWVGVPVWLGGVFLLAVALKSMSGGGQAMAMALLQAKSGAMRGATFRVNEVSAASPPERKDGPQGLELDDDVELTEEEKEEYRVEAAELRAEDAQRRWFWVDLTIIPSGSSSDWDADDLRFVPRGAPPPVADRPEDEDPQDTCSIQELQAWDGDGFIEPETVDYTGQQRLRLHVGVKPGVREIELRYWFERLGPIDLGSA